MSLKDSLRVVILSVLPVVSALAEAPFTNKSAPPQSGLGTVSSVSAALIAVLTLVFVLAWAMRRFKLPGMGNAQHMRVLQGVALGAKERAVLLQVKNRQLVIGIAPGTVNLLCDLGEVAETETPAAPATGEPSAAEARTQEFKAILKRSLGLK